MGASILPLLAPIPPFPRKQGKESNRRARFIYRNFSVAVLAAAVSSSAALAQGNAPAAYPVKPIRVLVPFPPGGTPDIHIRFMSDKLLTRLAQTFVVDNRAGASGNIAMETAARAQPDGYTLIIGTVGNWTVNPHLFKLSYDVLRDFTPVIQVATTPAVLVVHPAVAANSVKELIALAAKSPGALNYGSSGVGGFGHMCAELFAVMTKTKMTHVPYKGAALALTELTGGHILKSELTKFGKLIVDAGIPPASSGL